MNNPRKRKVPLLNGPLRDNIVFIESTTENVLVESSSREDCYYKKTRE